MLHWCYIDVDLHVTGGCLHLGASVHVSPDQGLVKMSQVGLGASMEFDEFYDGIAYVSMSQWLGLSRTCGQHLRNLWERKFLSSSTSTYFNFIQLFSTSFVSGFKERFKSCFSSPRKGSTMLNSTRRARWTKSLEAKLWKHVGLRMAYFSKDTT